MTSRRWSRGTTRCECWEVNLEPDELEALLARARKESPGAILQAFKAGGTPNLGAIEIIAAQTLAASQSGATLAERPEFDLLLRLAGTRQIGEAIGQVGYRSNGKRLFLVAAWASGGAEPKGLRRLASRDERFERIAKRPPNIDDLELVERAAILAAGP